MHPVYFCWLCDYPVSGSLPPYTDMHYESPHRQIFFCSESHWLSYKELKDL